MSSLPKGWMRRSEGQVCKTLCMHLIVFLYLMCSVALEEEEKKESDLYNLLINVNTITTTPCQNQFVILRAIILFF